MFDLAQIKSYFPQHLLQEEFMLKEYLQYKILGLIFHSKHARKLCFLGGTALRIAYQSQRFSEDIDFDNFGLELSEFESLSQEVQAGLMLEGLEVEIRVIQKGAFHCYIKIPQLLYKYELAPMKTQKILIQIDSAAQGYEYDPKLIQISKFDTQSLLRVCSEELLLAQKLYTVFERKRIKGRDFYDIIFLLGKTTSPERGYLGQKLDIHDPKSLKSRLLDKCEDLDFQKLQDDVQPFLFQQNNQSVSHFLQFIQQTEFTL